MAITVKRVKNERGVPLSSLKVGDTFLCDSRVGVIASLDGQSFAMELPTCRSFLFEDPRKQWVMIGPGTVVLPIEVEMTYKVVG